MVTLTIKTWDTLMLLAELASILIYFHFHIVLRYLYFSFQQALLLIDLDRSTAPSVAVWSPRVGSGLGEGLGRTSRGQFCPALLLARTSREVKEGLAINDILGG